MNTPHALIRLDEDQHLDLIGDLGSDQITLLTD